MKKFMILLFLLSSFGFSTFGSSSAAEFTLKLIKCSNYDVTYLDSYLNKNTVISYSVSNNRSKIDINFAFPIFGFVYITTDKKIYKIKLNDSKEASLVLSPNEQVQSITYFWYNLNCDYVKQLMLLNKNKNTCKFDNKKYENIKTKLLKIKKKIEKIKNNIFYKRKYQEIVEEYNSAINDLNNADLAIVENNCNKYKYYLNDANKKLEDLDNKLNNKNLFDLLISLVFG